MASTNALRRAAATAASNGLLPRLMTGHLRSTTVAPSITRSFNTSAQMKRYDEDDDDVSDLGVDRRRGEHLATRTPSFFSDVFDPFSPTRSLSQVLNLMDQLAENPLLGASGGLGSVGGRRGWDVKEDANALHLRMDMPGVGKENVKVSVEENTLTIKGEGEKEPGEEDEDGSPVRRYSSRINLPPKLFRLGEIKAEMKNGVLKVVVPKVEEEERKDVFHVKIE
ncbi:hypothetical protein MLD38_023532 [Melastoma candidum]|uniref:Uncharacterized protein n=1 Tax=Melastoma candidum TaxID=119954 RepID=A0ACB9NS60_9MYRT|nr:hypothetical protein MLD38_023532 [Melastoma candidum]